MRLLWWIPIGLAAAAAAFFVRARLRRDRDIGVTSDPVSADWLAQARSREEHRW